LLYKLLYSLQEYVSPLNVFRYVTFRAALCILTALFLSMCLGPWLIERLKRMQALQSIRDDGPQAHLKKAGTPTMGGLLIVLGIVVPTLLWASPTSPAVWLVVLVTLGFGAIGFYDDYLKLAKRNAVGLSGRFKLIWQVIIALAAVYVIYRVYPESTRISMPFFKNVNPDLGWLFIPFAVFVIVGTSNAVNLTDGLDGLAIGQMLVASATFMVLSYLTGHSRLAEYLQIPYVAAASELALLCGAILGAGLGFLWFNTYPAQVFMGDVGALSLGGALGTIAVIIRSEILLAIVGGIFVLEAVSVIIQVVSFKATGKRVFRMAPLHHHFELKGWAEPKVIVRFWIISVILALVTLSTLKLR